MNIEQMVKKLNEIGVPKHYYSINENLSSDTHVLNHIYGKWEYFYFDVKGKQNDYKIFSNENDACAYMYAELKNEIKY